MILKFQQGGNTLPPLAAYDPVTVTNTNTSKVQSLLKEVLTGSDLTDKDLLEMLEKLEGLPSDMQILTNLLLNFYIDQQYSPVPNTSNIASRYLSTLYLLKLANFNRKLYDNAFNTVNNNGGINEVAITDTGKLMCMNLKGDIKVMSILDLKNSEGYTPLTNSLLLLYRAYSPQMANNSDIIKVILNGIGMSSVTKMIKEEIQSLGSSENLESGYLNTSSKKILKGMEDFIRASLLASGENFNPTTDNLYKYKYITKDLAILALNAFEYVYNTLPENAKTLLMLKAPEHTEKGALELILKLITSKLNNTKQFDLDLEGSKTSKSSSKSSSSVKGNAFDMDPVSMLLAGYGLKQTINIQTAKGGNASIEIPTVRMPIVNKDGNSIGTDGTLNSVASSGFSGYLDFENASMGGVMIPTTGFGNVAINGTALYTGYLPVDMDEYNKTGNIKPDINMLERYLEVLKIIALNSITDKLEINNLYKEALLPLLYDDNGDIMINYRKFGMINASAIDKAFAEDAGFSDYLLEISDENEINNVLGILLKGRDKESKIDFDEKSWFDNIFGTSYDKLYKGTVFIPVNEDHFTATAGFGGYPTTSEAEVIEAKLQALERLKQVKSKYVNPGTL